MENSIYLLVTEEDSFLSKFVLKKSVIFEVEAKDHSVSDKYLMIFSKTDIFLTQNLSTMSFSIIESFIDFR